MRILLTGATGLLGSALLRLLLARGHETRCFVRADSPNISRLDGERVEILHGDAAREEDLYWALRDDTSPYDDLRLRAGQERAPSASLPRPLARLPHLRPWHEPLAACLPRRLRARRIRSPRTPRVRTPKLRPARCRTPGLPRPCEDCGSGPG